MGIEIYVYLVAHLYPFLTFLILNILYVSKLIMKGILNNIALTHVIKVIYWCYLEIEARTMAEMPHVKMQARIKADKHYPF